MERERDVLPNGLLRSASLNVREWLLLLLVAEVDSDCPLGPDDCQLLLRLEEELEDAVADVEPQCRRDCGAGAALSAGREGEVEDLEKVGTDKESTMLPISTAYIVDMVGDWHVFLMTVFVVGKRGMEDETVVWRLHKTVVGLLPARYISDD